MDSSFRGLREVAFRHFECLCMVGLWDAILWLLHLAVFLRLIACSHGVFGASVWFLRLLFVGVEYRLRRMSRTDSCRKKSRLDAELCKLIKLCLAVQLLLRLKPEDGYTRIKGTGSVEQFSLSFREYGCARMFGIFEIDGSN